MTIKPELAGGFKDYLPADMIPRQKMLDTIKQTFERFGFLPMETPGMEREEILVDESKTDFLIYRASTQEEGSKLAMRYDLTVPLARVVAANPELPRPFKRYQLGHVWRGEKQQAWRLREFTQCDIDIVGATSAMADAEVVAVIYETLSALGLTEFIIKVNNRKLLDQFSSEVLRSIDKLDKIGWEGVERELGDKAVEVKKFFSTEQTNEELTALIENAKLLGVPAENIMIDNTIVRGLSYYTGNVFETIITKMPIGSVFSGGRYDNLVERFTPSSMPAVGASIGVDRLFGVLDELGLIGRQKTTAKILILNFDETCQDMVQQVATDLRRADVATEVYLGQEVTLKGQLSYAVKQEYPFVLIIGSDEKANNTIQVKDMIARTQGSMSRDEAIKYIQRLLG